MRGNDFIFECVHSLYYECHEINVKRGGSHIDSLDWIKNKKATINHINIKDIKSYHIIYKIISI